MSHKILAPTPGRGFFLAVLFLSPFAVHSTGTPHQFFRKKGFSLYKREDFPWLGWGFCLWLRQGAFPAHWARRFHREQAHRPYFTAGIQPQAGASGRRFRRLHRCTGLKPKSEYSCRLAPAERISLLLFCARLFFCIRLWYPNGRIEPPTGPQGRRMNAHEIQ